MLDPTEVAPVDGYEIPQRLRAAVRARQIADVFAFGTCLSQKMDIDHTERYVPTDDGGPPGQTRLEEPRPDGPSQPSSSHPRRLAEASARAGLICAALAHGYVDLVTNQGTLALGRTDFSAAVWKASKPKRAEIAA